MFGVSMIFLFKSSRVIGGSETNFASWQKLEQAKTEFCPAQEIFSSVLFFLKGRGYLPELFRQIRTYLPELFWQTKTYLPEQVPEGFLDIFHLRTGFFGQKK